MDTYIDNTLEQNTQTVADLAITLPGALALFTKYNIDYCCGGRVTLNEACKRIGLDPEKLRRELSQVSVEGTGQGMRPENWSSAFLIDFIIQNHHSFVKKAIPETQALLDKVCAAHGNDCLEILQIRECFGDLSEELTSHMEKEERILFPAIKRITFQSSEDHNVNAAILAAPIMAMEHEHVLAGDLVKQIRSLSNNYSPPDFACTSFKLTYKKLQEFDNDLMKHVHLENNILFERLKDKKTEGGSCSL